MRLLLNILLHINYIYYLHTYTAQSTRTKGVVHHTFIALLHTAECVPGSSSNLAKFVADTFEHSEHIFRRASCTHKQQAFQHSASTSPARKNDQTNERRPPHDCDILCVRRTHGTRTSVCRQQAPSVCGSAGFCSRSVDFRSRRMGARAVSEVSSLCSPIKTNCQRLAAERRREATERRTLDVGV